MRLLDILFGIFRATIMAWTDRGDRMAATMVVPNLLWLGNTIDAVDVAGMAFHGIQARINLRTTKLSPLVNVATYWHPLMDYWGNSQGEFVDAVEMLQKLMDEKVPTLIHCQMGISRSTTVLATWWAKDVGITFDQAVDVIRKMRPFVQPHPGLRELARRYLKEIE